MTLPAFLSPVNHPNAFALLKPEQNKIIPGLSWIQVATDAPYFTTEEGKPWIPVGQNDAITWPDLSGMFRRKNRTAVEKYLAYLASHGVNCLRLMLEYCQTENRYLERPAGTFQPNMVRLWDDLLSVCQEHGLRVLLTPFDTFWMRKRWRQHPYNRQNGGPCVSKTKWLCCPDMLQAVKDRMHFATERWGKSGVVFAWDVWNEPDPLHAGNSVETIADFITEISAHIRKVEMQLYGRTHLQTAGGYWPHMVKHKALSNVIFRHPSLDFATVHFYGISALDKPGSTLLPAIRMGELVSKVLPEMGGNRPFFDSEHGPVKAYGKRRQTLPEPFDNNCFRYTQWAHMASGGAGGGMRWPYRHPHSLTKGMRLAQKSLSGFMQEVNWLSFNRKNLSNQIKSNCSHIKVFACGTRQQVIIWLADKKQVHLSDAAGTGKGTHVQLCIPALAHKSYSILLWDTLEGKPITRYEKKANQGGNLLLELGLQKPDIAMLVSLIPES